ncbi:MAG: hypothetical protein JO189_11655 [Deltaproteobacteria bacterium]|nr:hypothetical protein [Deltaproteobacteria bacterium]
MANKNVSDMAQDAAASVQGATDTAKDYASKGADTARDYANKGYNAARDYTSSATSSAREYANKGYDAARDYANTGMDVAARMSDNLTEFVRNEPWVAVTAAFAIGYVAARLLRRLSI